MEPYRPVIDVLVYHISVNGTEEVSKVVKKNLSTIHFLPLKEKHGGTTVGFAVRDMAVSFSKIYLKESDKPVSALSIPKHKYIEEHYEKCLG